MTLLVRFIDDAAVDPSLTGQKFAGLARMSRWPRPDRPRIPEAVAVTTEAWRRVVHHNGLEAVVERAVAGDEVAARTLSAELRGARLPDEVDAALAAGATRLLADSRGAIAVRSSAVAEDLAGRSFAGQYLTRLNVADVAGAVSAYLGCLASAWEPGVRRYRVRTSVDSAVVDDPAMAVMLQVMAHHGEGWAGAAISDGRGGVTVEAVRGLGDTLMSGRADPLRWAVTGGEEHEGRTVATVVDWVRRAERREGHAVEVEFALRPGSPEPLLLQLRSHAAEPPAVRGRPVAATATAVVSGLAVGSGTARGTVCRLDGPDDHDRLVPGAVLVTASTDPGWLPLLGEVAAVVTDHGGLTSHAAIVCRELGLLAVVGCGDATQRLLHGHGVEVRCDGPTGSVSPLG